MFACNRQHPRLTRKTKKHCFTLLECLIAFSFTAILVFVLFSFYRQNTLTNIASASAKKVVLARQHVQQRLSQVFKGARMPDDEEKKVLPLFHLDSYGESFGYALHFSFDNGIDPKPAFCGLIKGVLYLDLKKNLCLDTYSSKGEKRKEILLSQIQSLDFSFFETSENVWQSVWKEEEEDLPAFFKLSLKEEAFPDRLLEFAFLLPEESQEISYQRKGAL